MTALKLQDGTITSDPKIILQEQARFFQNLYTKNPDVKFNLDHLPGAKLSKEQTEFTNQKLTLEELSLALQAMPNGKTCGCDGLSTEFYKFFWPKLKQVYFNAIQHAVQCGSFFRSTKRGIITLIPKKNRDPLSLKNWRPLTMLNVDFKIYSKALANRMKRVLPTIISEDQTGFMKGRNIATNI